MNWKKAKTCIPLSRLLIYLVIIGLAPLFLVIYHFSNSSKEWEQISQKIFQVGHLSETKARKQYLNNLLREKYQETDQFYLDHQLESLTLLKKETEALENLISIPTFTGNEAAEQRYSFITSIGNKLQFTGNNVSTGDGFTETNTSLAHPVEADAQDVKEILNRIEGNRPGKPQLIVTDFKLNKKALPGGNEVYDLNMKLLKREFLKCENS